MNVLKSKLVATSKICLNVLLLTSAFCIATNYSSAQCIYFKKLSSGPESSHCLGIAKDGTLWAWGNNQNGEVGNNSTDNVAEPVQISTATGWQDVATGDSHSLAIDSNGSLWGWGNDYEGQLGDGQAIGAANVMTPKRIKSPDSTWKAIAASGSHSMGITADGRLWVWGYGTFINSTGNINSTPVQAGTDTDWVAITTGGYHFIAIKRDSTLWGWGRDAEGQAGDSTTTDNVYLPPVRIDSSHQWIAISAGSDHTLALQKDGSLWSWGRNTYGQLGNGTTDDGKKGPKQVGTAKYIAIGAGTEFSLAVSKDSLRWLSGSNLIGQFGNDEGGSGFHISLVPLLSDSSKHWAKVYGGSNASYNVTADGTAWAGGDNGTEQLGDGNNGRSNVLIKVGTPSPYPALAASGDSDIEYQRGYSYYATNCSNLITAIYKTGANPLHNITTARVWIDDAVNNDHTGKPYVQRHYGIHPSSGDTTATGTVILYFTQGEFTAYNAAANVMNGTYPMLPVDAGDAQGYRGNLRINKIIAESSDASGNLNTYNGTLNLIAPASVVYGDGRWQVTIDVTGFGGFFATTVSSVLPVTWINVAASVNNYNQAVINWKVNEISTASYNVEKSIDGIAFKSIAAIAGKGEGINAYQYTDSLKVISPLFYRIRQTDIDGKFSYSLVVALNNVSNTRVLSLYPNPVNEHLFVNGLKPNTKYHIGITDMSGKTIFSKDISGVQNEVITNSLNKGVYFIKIMTANYSTVLKFIRQ